MNNKDKETKKKLLLVKLPPLYYKVTLKLKIKGILTTTTRRNAYRDNR